ncbi:MAG: lasso RiPP family leader peptide-containing protein [Gemmatimonadota bacterium]
MTDRKPDPTERAQPDRKPYEKPSVKRWGTLRELTRGGGGTLREPITKRRTRF